MNLACITTSDTASSTWSISCGRHVVSRWKRARGSNQYATKYEARCETCGQRIVKGDRRAPQEEP